MKFIKKYHSDNISNYYESIFITYIFIATLFSISLFLYGFFPIKNNNNPLATMNDIPKTINNINANSDYLYKPVARKIIFMVIDALRWDFINDTNKYHVMPFTRGSILNNSAHLLQVNVNPPTVTMPRVKAMMSGDVSTFIDVALNFGKTSITIDNVLVQAKNHGHNIIFYGDDTWLKLFPNIFYRSDGTTSFFVSDYTEVDINVTRHINDELNIHNDWSIMILHYLGLDHIGHVYGPQSPLIKPKLDEMDIIIRDIATKVKQWNENNLSSMFIICGDHGMKNSGGHGGSTIEETLVPLIAFGSNYTDNINNNPININQVDIATTLAVIMGIPIPSSSIGTVSLDIIDNLPLSNKLFILYYNAKCILEQFKKLSDYETQSGYINYIKAINMHTKWLNNNENSPREINEIIHEYYNALNEMKNLLIHNMIHYNVIIMSIAVILMCHIIIIILNCNINGNFSSKKFIYWWLSSIGLWLLLNYIFYYDNNDTAFTIINDIRLVIIIIIFININCYLCTKVSLSNLININWNYSNVLLLLAIILHTLSLGSSSFIEEEHQTWYYFLSSFFILQLFINIQKFHQIHIGDVNNINRIIMNIGKIILILFIHRVLSKLNSTGDKYSHLSDISDWLNNRESNIEMTIVLIIALILLILIGFITNDIKYRKISLIFHIIISILIYLRHISNDTVIKPFYYPKSSGIYEVKIFWITVMGLFIYSIVNSCTLLISNNIQKFTRQILYNIIQLWIIISALLHRPNNIILLPMQLITCAIVFDIFKYNKNKMIHLIIIYCLGNVYYFYQGNSNSLATIDVAAGYIGLQSFILPIVTLLLCINTFSATILAYLLLLYRLIVEEQDYIDYEKIFSINRCYIVLKFFSLTVYTIIITIMRYHLFVWSTFAPKLLYEAMNFTVLIVVVFIIQNIFIFVKSKYAFKINK